MRRVVVTGVGALSPLGNDWPTVFARLKRRQNAIVVMESLQQYEGMLTRLAAPTAPFTLDEKVYNRKTMRGMGRVAMMATRASELALRDAGLFGDPVLKSGKVGVSYGSSLGLARSPSATSGACCSTRRPRASPPPRTSR